jgi:hypothetical protein
MYRAAADSEPDTFGGLVQWHKHGHHSGWMTHDWLVKNPVSAWATCIPWRALEAEGIATYERYRLNIHNSAPCPDTDKHGL